MEGLWCNFFSHHRFYKELKIIYPSPFCTYQSPCSSDPCMFNGTCLRGFTYKKYLCVCQDGYWGENCERGEAYCACYTRLSFVRHSGEISEHACNAREILGVQRNGNDSISSVTVLRKNGGILKISIVCFHFAKQIRSLKTSQSHISLNRKKILLSQMWIYGLSRASVTR